MAAEAGYDVWLGNLRGNKYCNDHETLDYEINAKDFYNFDIEHHSSLDLVATIDYIQFVASDYEKIAYVGHSMGTTVMFRLAA